MIERRESPRDKVVYGGVAEIDESTTRDCVVRDISENGANLEFKDAIRLSKEQISLTIARKGRSFLAKIVWLRNNFVGVAFSGETLSELPVSDLASRPQPMPERFGRNRVETPIEKHEMRLGRAFTWIDQLLEHGGIGSVPRERGQPHGGHHGH